MTKRHQGLKGADLVQLDQADKKEALHLIVNNPLGQRVLKVVKSAGGEARFVGGIVRDALAGIAPQDWPDIDMAMTLTPDVAMQAFKESGLKTLPTGIDHGTITVFDKKDHRQKIELTTLRADQETDGRHAEVIFTEDWAGDAARRDFTINAIYLDGAGMIFDPCHGCDDLAHGILRFIGNAEDRIEEDYLRILRFFRFHARFAKTEPDQETMAAITKFAPRLDQISGERQAMELARLLPMGSTSGLSAMVATGVDRVLTPSGFNTDAMAKLSKLAQSVSIAVLPLAACYAVLVDHDQLPALLERLRLSQKLRRQITYMANPIKDVAGFASDAWRIHAWGAKPHADADRTDLVWRYATTQAKASQMIGHDEFYRLLEWQAPQLPIKGQDLLDRGIARGPSVGQQLKTLEDAWVASGFSLTRDDLLARLG